VTATLATIRVVDAVVIGLAVYLAAIWLVGLAIVVFDVGLDPALPGWVKALWIVLALLFPIVTAVVYLAVRGGGIRERRAAR
jgi:hypothetical protein